MIARIKSSFYDNNGPHEICERNKCHWGRLFSGSTMGWPSYTVPLVTTAQKSTNKSPRMVISPLVLCTCIYVCEDLDDGTHPLELHLGLLAYERCLTLHRREIRWGFAIFSDIFGPWLLFFFPRTRNHWQIHCLSQYGSILFVASRHGD